MALLLASEIVYAALAFLDATSGVVAVSRFLIVMLVLFMLYAGAVALVTRGIEQNGLTIIVAGAILFRLTLLPAGLPPTMTTAERIDALSHDVRGRAVAFERFLLYDHDLWRFLWEGHVSSHGRSPYRFAPADPRLDGLDDEGRGDSWELIRSRVNNSELTSVYPPLAQLLFVFSHAIAPASVVVFKSIVVLIDLAAIGVMVAILRLLGRPPEQVVLYAWNPLVVKVFAGSGHFDVLVVLALAVLLHAVLVRSRWVAALAFAGSVMAKLVPIVLLPLVLVRIGWRRASIVLVPCFVILAAIAAASTLSGVSAFGREWEFNAGVYALLRFWIGDAQIARLACAGAFAAIALLLLRRDDRSFDAFAVLGSLILGALLLLSPVVTPWYVTWLLPFALVARHSSWFVFTALVCLAFVVMVDGREYPLVQILEYSLLGIILLREIRVSSFALFQPASRLRPVAISPTIERSHP